METFMSEFRLHYFPESGNSYKLALMLTLCGQSFEPVWTETCPAPTLVPSVHFSGGDVAQDVAANRADIAVYGVTDYVAIGCEGGPILHDPLTGAAL